MSRRSGSRTTRRRPRSEILALLGALLVLLGVAVNTISCGDDDLILPGSIPFTETPEPDATDTPDDGEEVLLPLPVRPRAVV